MQDRVLRAKKSYPRIDSHGEWMRCCSELAEETGADVAAVYEEWNDRVSAMLYTGEHDVYEAEQRAMDHIRTAYRMAS